MNKLEKPALERIADKLETVLNFFAESKNLQLSEGFTVIRDVIVMHCSVVHPSGAQ
jgi:hypothetical protein